MQKVFNSQKLKKRRKDLRKNQTDAEALLWQYLRNKQVNNLKFYRQYSVSNYIVDFYCPSKRLAIEVDGGQHAENKSIVYDDKRSEYLKQQGITVVRFWNNDVLENLEGVFEHLVEVLQP